MSEHLFKIIQSIICFLVAGLIFWFYTNGKLTFFVHPNYVNMIVVSAGFLTLLGVAFFFTKSHYCCEHDHKDFIAPHAAWLLLLIPLTLGFTIPPKPLSSETATARGISSDVSLLTGETSDFQFAIRSEDKTLLDWVKTFNLDPEPENYAGSKVDFEGMVLKSDTLPPGYFLIAKFFIACCAADARPIGVPVRFDPSKFQPKDNEWIRIKGEIMGDTIADERRAVIDLESFETIPVPENPYIY